MAPTFLFFLLLDFSFRSIGKSNNGRHPLSLRAIGGDFRLSATALALSTMEHDRAMLGDLLRLELDYLPDATYLQASEMVSRDLRQEMIGFIIEVRLWSIHAFTLSSNFVLIDC